MRQVALLLCGLLIGISWFLPLSVTGAILACLSFIAFCTTTQIISVRGERPPYFFYLLAGMVAHLFGFHWIFETIRHFGEFPILGALFVFLIFITLSSIQFPLFLFIRRNLPGGLDRFCLRSPLAWIAVELLAIRIFPWSASHPLGAIAPLIQLAEFGGSTLNTFIFIWICEALGNAMIFNRTRLMGGALLGAAGVYVIGTMRITQIENAPHKMIPIALIQGAIPLQQKHDRSLTLSNLSEYQRLSGKYTDVGTLVVWPETVLMDWIPENVGSVANDSRLPTPAAGTSLVFGALSYRSRHELFNSAFAISPDGSIPLPYHKRILMPFGEFTPFGDIFPYLRTLNNTGGDFTPGSGDPILKVPLQNKETNEIAPIPVTPLICYEDVLPDIAAEGTKNGAQLLVNLTNDAWFGESIAPLQHHQIAQLRAVENRRTLIRATNTGFSAVVSPAGKTVLWAPLFGKESIAGTAALNDQPTFFANWPIRQAWLVLAIIASCLSIFRFLTIRKETRSDEGAIARKS